MKKTAITRDQLCERANRKAALRAAVDAGE